MNHRMRFAAPLLAGAALCASTPAGAVVTPITPVDTPDCDLLALPSIVDELGYVGFFPFDEGIDASGITTTALSACPATDNPGIPNVLMTLGNFTSSVSWTNLHYVADFETSISNDDGLVSGGLAFRFDAVGVNKPLLAESIAADGILAPGETWTVIIQDYVNTLGIGPAAFFSVGVPTSGGPSSGSIIALPVPGPGGAMILAIAAMGGCRRRRLV